MFKRMAMLAMLSAALVSCTMWNKPPSGWSGITGGEQLEKLFWDDVQAKRVKSLDQHIAANFAGSGPGGALDRDAFLRQLEAYQGKAITLRDCNTRLNGGDLMITCVVQREAAPQASTLSVWQQLKHGWVMVAHAETSL